MKIDETLYVYVMKTIVNCVEQRKLTGKGYKREGRGNMPKLNLCMQCSGYTVIKMFLKDKEVSFSITNQTINGVKGWPE